MRREPIAVYKSPDGRFFVFNDWAAGVYYVLEWPSERQVDELPFWSLRDAIKACDKAYRDHAGLG